jgi:hypothetical protein
MPTPAEVIETVFTTANPTTGSLPPPAMAWAVFANGTVFFTAPSDELALDAEFDAIADAAHKALRDLGPVQAGTPSADFNVVQLDGWFPETPIWFVTFDHEAIATIVDTATNELGAGLTGRGLRQQDHDEQRIIVVRRFDGSVRPH